MTDKPVCPRCGGMIPNNSTPGAYPGALSRWDNETEICSQCGTEEAMLQLNKISISPDGPFVWNKRPWSFYDAKPDWWDDETEPRCDACGRHMEDDDPEWPMDGDGRCSVCIATDRK